MPDNLNWLISDYTTGWIRVGTLHFTIPALAAALPELGGRDTGDMYLIPADRRADVETILATAERVPTYNRAAEDAEAARYGLVRGDELGRGSHPLGRRIGTVPGGTVYASDLGDGDVTIYDRS